MNSLDYKDNPLVQGFPAVGPLPQDLEELFLDAKGMTQKELYEYMSVTSLGEQPGTWPVGSAGPD